MPTRCLSALTRSAAVWSALAVAGCSSDLPTRESQPPAADLNPAYHAAVHEALLSKIGRGLAVALADPATRQWVRSRIDASPYVEWRIPFRQVLLREVHLPQVHRVLQLARMTPLERQRQKSLPDLELYFPIPQHRNQWQPGDPVQVAVRIGHGDTYTVYSMDGTSSSSRGDHMPATATLVLAWSEIDYTDAPSALRGGSRTGSGTPVEPQQSESRAGTMAVSQPPEPPPPTAPTGGANSSRHTRLSYFRTSRHHDDWLGGNDEVEIFGSVLGGFAECTWRTDVQPNRDYPLDLANSFWTIATAIPWGTATVFIDAFEDDDGRCVRRSSDDRYGSTFLRIDYYGIIVGTSNPGHIAVRVHSVVP